MNSLVGYRVSSESDSDGDVGDEATAVKKTRNFLLESGSASSDSGSESDPEEKNPDPASSPPLYSQTAAPAPSAACEPTVPAPSLGSLTSSKLPPPPLNARSDSSVFTNPFKAQADKKLSTLQKHVPLTMEAKPSQIGGKRMCVSYRKDGRCRFGIKCKFAHDSDLQTPATATDCHSSVSDEAPVSEHAEAYAGGSCGGGSQNLTQEEKSEGQQVKKRRPGLSNTLIPPKRAMKQYAMQRDRERLNMS
uniref:C3H1-type domain-containing protein n=1 Tax=Monopterus albus TaxID=43700 RepID=A0A3Q3Q938_MONAL